jgi:hypothetical protein
MDNKLFRQARNLVIMIAIAGSVFLLAEYVRRRYQLGAIIDFEQEMSVSLLAAAIVPVLVYRPSEAFRERLLTLLQVVILIVTAGFGFLARFVVDKGVGLFLAWFVCADIATIVLVYMFDRFRQKNGLGPTSEELDNFVRRFHTLELLEVLVEEQILKIRGRASERLAEITFYERMLDEFRQERGVIERLLHAHGIHPPSVVESLSEEERRLDAVDAAE